MEEIFDLLFSKLYNKGLISVEILRLIRDVLNVVDDGSELTVGTLNKKLENLGWREKIMDEFCFQLLISLIENKDDQEVLWGILHSRRIFHERYHIDPGG